MLSQHGQQICKNCFQPILMLLFLPHVGFDLSGIEGVLQGEDTDNSSEIPKSTLGF